MKLFRQNTLRHLTALFLLAFFIKAMMPVGFMQGTSESGKTEIVICTGYGQTTKLVDIAQTPFAPEEHKEQQNDHPPCPYAPVLAQGLADITPAILPFHIGLQTYDAAPASSIPYGIISKPWMAQGPPLFS